MSQQDQPLPLFAIDFEAARSLETSENFKSISTTLSSTTLRSGSIDRTHKRNIFNKNDNKKGRLLAFLPCVKYGKINSLHGALLVFEFNFHPINETRFELAEIKLAFDKNSEVKALGPEYVVRDESYKII
jgi:hypothetical protein